MFWRKLEIVVYLNFFWPAKRRSPKISDPPKYEGDCIENPFPCLGPSKWPWYKTLRVVNYAVLPCNITFLLRSQSAHSTLKSLLSSLPFSMCLSWEVPRSHLLIWPPPVRSAGWHILPGKWALKNQVRTIFLSPCTQSPQPKHLGTFCVIWNEMELWCW